MPRTLAVSPCLLLAAVLVLPGPALGAGNPDVAALQVALHGRRLYGGTVDGVLGPGTKAAVRRFQRRAGLVPDGVAGPRTRAALGRYGRRAPLGRRPLSRGARGWDVAALQFSLAWHGFPSGPMDGVLGARTDAALRRFQAWAGMKPDGTAGGATLAALHRPPPTCPIALARPVDAPLGDPFGPRGVMFHAGVDLIAPLGTPVAAAAPGRVEFVGANDGWGNLVVVSHESEVDTLYAHLSRMDVRVGQTVAAGTILGRVGATGDATGPHLHFEVHLRGASVDPLTGLS
jgi:murein DD-endopeptidase MepM/ murein hydrolase activator NlpD